MWGKREYSRDRRYVSYMSGGFKEPPNSRDYPNVVATNIIRLNFLVLTLVFQRETTESEMKTSLQQRGRYVSH
jgi:hypothetical protein